MWIVLLINIKVSRILAKESDKLYENVSQIGKFYVSRNNWVPVVDKGL